MKEVIKQKIYEAMDSFLVEAKDQHGNERSLEQLNRDRHLFVERMEGLFVLQKKETLKEIALELKEKYKKRIKENAYQPYWEGGYCQAIDDLEQLSKDYE